MLIEETQPAVNWQQVAAEFAAKQQLLQQKQRDKSPH
jgi:hypothetical protein